jgi:hypothetical protein
LAFFLATIEFLLTLKKTQLQKKNEPSSSLAFFLAPFKLLSTSKEAQKEQQKTRTKLELGSFFALPELLLVSREAHKEQTKMELSLGRAPCPLFFWPMLPSPWDLSSNLNSSSSFLELESKHELRFSYT